MLKPKLSLLAIFEIIIISSIFLSGLVLFLYEKKNHDLDYQKSWTSFYFVDSYSPEKGAKIENHLGKETEFVFCLIKDNNNLTEPEDLSCDLAGVSASKKIPLSQGETTVFNYNKPAEKGKYWILTIYNDATNAQQKRSLSFTLN